MSMVLCDIGNTNLHFCYNGTIWHESPGALRPKKPEVKIFYISVNEKNEQKLLKSHKNCINIAPFFSGVSEYEGLGVDRAAAIFAISKVKGSGVVLDAGSAITIDAVAHGAHLGGAILPGVFALKSAFASISPALNRSLDISVNLHTAPQNTKAAMGYGVIKSVVLLVNDFLRMVVEAKAESSADSVKSKADSNANSNAGSNAESKADSNAESPAQKEPNIYLTGGDGHFFSRFFENGYYDSTLVFKGMAEMIRAQKIGG